MPNETLTDRLVRDQEYFPIQSAGRLKFQDGATVPIVSPKTNVGTTAQAFRVPAGALAMVFNCSGACRYGDNSHLDGTAADKGYDIGAADEAIVYPCCGMEGKDIYVRAESGTVTVRFHFELA